MMQSIREQRGVHGLGILMIFVMGMYVLAEGATLAQSQIPRSTAQESARSNSRLLRAKDFIVVTDTNMEIWLSAPESGTPVTGGTGDFGGVLFLTGNKQSRFWEVEGKYGGGEITGWVRAPTSRQRETRSFDTFLTNEGTDTKGIICRQVEFIDDVDDVRKTTSIDRKIVVKLTPDSVSGKHHENLWVNVYSSPDLAEDHRITRVGHFELQYLYAEREDAVLVGAHPVLNLGNARRALIGWIPKDFTIDWNTREVFRFDKNSFEERTDKAGLGKVLNTEDLVLKYLNGQSINAAEDIAGWESKTAEPLAYNLNFFPVLDRVEGGDNPIYEVAYIGELNANLNLVNDQVSRKQLRIALLIDATQGMQDLLPHLKAALTNFFERRLKAFNLQVAVAIYRDWPDKASGPFWIEQGFTRNGNSIISAINRIDAKSASGDQRGLHTIPEALFFGLDQVARKLPWSDSNHNHVFLIGDHGNHTSNDLDPAFHRAYVNAANYLDAGEIRALYRKNNIFLHALQVHRGGSDREQEIRRRFSDQIVKIQGEGSVTQSFVKADVDNERDYLEGLEKVVKIATGIHNNLVCLRGDPDRWKQNKCGIPGYGGSVQFREEVAARYQAQNIRQVVRQGFISERDGNNIVQMDQRVLVTKRQVNLILRAVSELLDLVLYGSKMQSKDHVENAIVQMVKILTGDDNPRGDAFISDFISKRAGVRFQSRFLQTSVNELAAALYDGDLRGEARKLSEKRHKIDAFFSEKIVLSGNWDDDIQEWIPIYQTDKSGNFVTEKRFFYYERSLASRADPENIYMDGEGAAEVKVSGRNVHAWFPIGLLP